jgi:signal transduction histidine kinase
MNFETDKRKSTLIPFIKRFCMGVPVEGDEKHVVHLQLPDEFKYGSRARVVEDDFPIDWTVEKFRKEKVVPIFLLKPTSNDPGLWHASARWGTEENNPWQNNRPQIGKLLYGEVVRYVENYAVKVRLDNLNGLEATLHRKNVPGVGYGKISRYIEIGDRVAGIVTQVDPKELNIWISVNDLMSKREKEEKLRRRSIAFPNEDNPPKECATENPPLYLNESTRVLFCGRDPHLGESIKNWVHVMGGRADWIFKPTEIMERIRRGSITHLLVIEDSPSGLWYLSSELCDVSIPVALCGPDSQKSNELSRQEGWTCLSKPLDHRELSAWLRGEKIEKTEQNRNSTLWKGRFEEKGVQEKAGRFLKKICKETKCLGALWIKRERKGVFSIRSDWGLDREKLDTFPIEIPKTIAATVIEHNVEIEREIGDVKFFQDIVPKGVRYTWAFPLDMEGKTNRCIVFFRGEEFTEEVKEEIRYHRERMRDMVDNLNLVQFLREVQAFAAIGMVQSGLLHEVRHVAGIILPTLTNLIKSLDRGQETKKIRSDLKGIEEQARKMAELTKTDLQLIQKKRYERVGINEVTRRIVRLVELKQRNLDVKIDFQASPKEIILSLPPIAVEQPLLNLLDNAIFHSKSRSWGRIIVSVRLYPGDTTTPIHVLVEDNGLGMTASEHADLLTPRASSKGKEGVGMGLYVTRNLLNSVGGDLVLETCTRWMGTTFCIKLPLRWAKLDEEEVE